MKNEILPRKIEFQVGKFGEFSTDMMGKKFHAFISNFITTNRNKL